MGCYLTAGLLDYFVLFTSGNRFGDQIVPFFPLLVRPSFFPLPLPPSPKIPMQLPSPLSLSPLAAAIALLALLASPSAARTTAAAAADKPLVSAPWTDPATGIAFQALQHETGFRFGVALPKTPGADFIGVLVRRVVSVWRECCATGDCADGYADVVVLAAVACSEEDWLGGW
jgi:Cytochrome domain of cellobiose dehydrogenase